MEKDYYYTTCILFIFLKQINLWCNLYQNLNNDIYIIIFNLLLILKRYFKIIENNILNKLSFKKNLELFKHILTIKTVSKTTRKGRIRRFQVVLSIGAFSNWIGIGKGKDTYLSEAIEKAYLNSFNNIFYKKNKSNIILNNKKIKYKASKLILNTQFNKHSNIIRAPFWLFPILESLSITNVSCKIIGSRNKLNIIKSIINFYC